MDWMIADGPWVTLARPVWLAAAVAVVVPVALAAWGRRRGRRTPPAAVAGQCLAVGLASLALAKPQVPIDARTRRPYLLLSDASASVRGQQATAAGLAFPPGAAVERFAFADGLSRSPASARDGATRIGPALRMIASRARAGLAGAVVTTDGRFTDSNWAGAEAVVAGSGVDVVIVPLDAPGRDARIAAIQAVRRADAQVDLTVTVSANVSAGRTLTVRRSGRGEPLLARRLSLLADSAATIRWTDRVPPDVAAEYVAELDAADFLPENDRAAVVVLPTQRQVAAVGLDASARAILSQLGEPIAHLRPDGLPTEAGGLARFAAVVVADATGEALTAPQRRALGEYVRAGGGLLMIGVGPHAAPADLRDPLNRVLALLANPFQRRPLALVVALDRSGSMGQTTTGEAERPAQRKFDLAAEAVVALTDHLTARDTLAVVAFAAGAETIYDSRDAAPDFAAVRDALRQVRPTGSTKVAPALAEALARTPAAGRTPMVLVVSDLQTQDENFDPAAWADRFDRGGVKLGVVAIGAAAATPPALEQLAKRLKAPYVRQDDLSGLAKVFATMVRRGRGEAIRQPVPPAPVKATAALFDTPVKDLPPVSAYVLTAVARGAELLARTAGGDPICARRQAGLGRSVSVAIRLGATDNVAWRSDAAAAQVLAAAARWVLRAPNDPRFDGQVRRDGNLLHVAVTAAKDGVPINRLDLTAAVASGPDVRTAPAEQTAPGRYEATLACPADAAAAVAVRLDAAVVWRAPVVAMCAPEFRAIGLDRRATRDLAGRTGGRIVPADRIAETLRQAYRRRLTDLWPFLLGAAGAVMLAEWCLTRLTRR